MLRANLSCMSTIFNALKVHDNQPCAHMCSYSPNPRLNVLSIHAKLAFQGALIVRFQRWTSWVCTKHWGDIYISYKWCESHLYNPSIIWKGFYSYQYGQTIFVSCHDTSCIKIKPYIFLGYISYHGILQYILFLNSIGCLKADSISSY